MDVKRRGNEGVRLKKTLCWARLVLRNMVEENVSFEGWFGARVVLGWIGGYDSLMTVLVQNT